MPRVARCIALVCLAAFSIPVPSQGSPREERKEPARLTAAAAHAFARFWSVVVAPWPSKAGTIADPNGQCSTGPSPSCGQQPPGEAGTILDPNGGA
jgi:hypothetical protein